MHVKLPTRDQEKKYFSIVEFSFAIFRLNTFGINFIKISVIYCLCSTMFYL